MQSYIFDARAFTPSTGTLPPLPNGIYNVINTDGKLKPTQAGPQMLWLEFTVLDPAHAGRKIYSNYNLWNANPKTAEWAHNDLSALGYVINTHNTDVVLGCPDFRQKPFQLRIEETIGKDGRKQNEIKEYFDAAGNKPNGSGAAPAAAPAGPVAPQAIVPTTPPAFAGQPVAAPAQPLGTPVGQPAPVGLPPQGMPPQPMTPPVAPVAQPTPQLQPQPAPVAVQPAPAGVPPVPPTAPVPQPGQGWAGAAPGAAAAPAQPGWGTPPVPPQ